MRKCLIWILCCSIIFNTTFFNALALDIDPWAKETESENVILDFKLKRAKSVLEGLGLYTFTGDNYEGYVKREQFAFMTWSLLGTQKTASNKSEFIDVDNKGDFFDAIQWNKENGYINGYSNNVFGTGDIISSREAAYVLLKIMGYDTYMQQKGGYPLGMINIVDKVLKDINIYSDERLTFARAIQMCYNAMTAEILQVESLTADSVTYSEEENYTLLKEYYNISFDEGIITGNSFTTLGISKQKGVSSNILIIDDKEYSTEDIKGNLKYQADKMLGYNVLYFYDENEEKLKYVYSDDKLTTVNTISADDTLSLNSNGNLEVHTDTKKSTYNVKQTADIIENGTNNDRKAHMLTENDFRIPNGTITLIDNNHDKVYDVVLIDEVQIYIVNNVDDENCVIYDMFGKDALLFDMDELNDNNLIVKNKEKPVKLSGLKKWDVLEVTVSKNKELIRANLVTGNTVSGIIDSISKADDKVWIGSKEYKVYTKFSEGLEEKYNPFKVSLGTNATFLCDSNNRVILVRNTDYKDVYGFLINCALKRSISGGIEFKILDSSGKIQIFEGKKKIKLNNITRNSDAICSMLSDESGKVVQQLIKYSLDSEGKIANLKTGYDEWSPENSVPYENSLNLSAYKATRQWKNNTSFFGFDVGDGTFDPSTTELKDAYKEFYIDKDTLLIRIPDISKNDYDDRDYALMQKSELQNDTNYIATAYDVDDEYVASVVLLQEPEGNIDDSTGAFAIIRKISMRIDEYGDENPCIDVYHEGVEKRFIINDSSYLYLWNSESEDDKNQKINLADLHKGDIVRLAWNINNEVLVLQKMIPNSNDGIYSKDASSFVKFRNLFNEKAFGRVYDKWDDGFTLQVFEGNTPTSIPYKFWTNTIIYQIDVNTKEISIVDSNKIYDIKHNNSDNMVLLRARNTLLYEVIIINFD